MPGFSTESVQRISSSVIFTESQNRTTDDKGKPSRLNPIIDLRYGKTTTSIAAISGSTMGSGTVAFVSCPLGVISANGSTITAYNASSQVIASGTFVVVAWIGGIYFVIYSAC